MVAFNYASGRGSTHELGSTSSDSESYSLTADRRGVSTESSHSLYGDSMDESYRERVTVASAKGVYKLSRTPRLPYKSDESHPSFDMAPMSMEEFGRSLSYN